MKNDSIHRSSISKHQNLDRVEFSKSEGVLLVGKGAKLRKIHLEFTEEGDLISLN